jgi:glycosyltransferase involved in cell wall biosynthesis
MIEALACGTPVISFAEGSAPEIVRHRVNGFLVEDEASMAAAIAKIDAIDRSVCRHDALQRFDARRMVLEYEQLYGRALDPTFDVFAGLPAHGDLAAGQALAVS